MKFRILNGLAAFLLSCPLFAQPDTSSSQMEQPRFQHDLKNLEHRLRFLRDDLMDFWLRNGPDPLYGGFHGTLDQKGQPLEKIWLGKVNGFDLHSEDKSTLQQSRHIWALSTYHQMLKDSGETPPAMIEGTLESTRHFLLKNMRDPKDDRFYFMVSRNGEKVIHDGKHLYSNLFAIYGLAKHAEVFGDEESRMQALRTFLSYDREFYDATYGGYDETGLLPVKDNGILPSGRLSKPLDIILHALEALTQLHRVVSEPQEADLIAKRILELLSIAYERTLHEDGAYIHENFYTDWSKHFGNGYLVYGHQLEFLWLAFDALDHLRERDVVTPEFVKLYKDRFTEIGRTMQKRAIDSNRGGLYLVGVQDKTTNTDKHFWAQAEALLAFWTLYEYTGDLSFLDSFENVLMWVEKYQRDSVYGEWFAFLTESGGLAPRYTGLGMSFPVDIKGGAMKASYHSGRSMMLLTERLRRHELGISR